MWVSLVRHQGLASSRPFLRGWAEGFFKGDSRKKEVLELLSSWEVDEKSGSGLPVEHRSQMSRVNSWYDSVCQGRLIEVRAVQDVNVEKVFVKRSQM